jgi:CubicO group peptidase (beta-lactamase class C family)
VAHAVVETAVDPLERDIPEIEALMSRALRSGKTPGAVIVIGRREGVVFKRAYGRRSIIPERQEMTLDTIFDLASLTKPLVVGALMQWLAETGKLRIEDRAAAYLPDFGVRGKQDLTIEQLLLHTSGLPPTNPLSEYRKGAEQARARALGSWLFHMPGRHFMYSDLGYIALGELIEQVTGERLDQTAERVLWKPLGMTDTRYCPKMCDDPRVAPTELSHGWKRSPIRGEVHDPRAYRLGGVAGNAGLFSTADDVARFARMLLGGGQLDGVRVLQPASVRQFIEPRVVPDGQRALGWDVSSGFSAPRGKELSEHAFGHGGYTGTSLWIDPELDLFIVFLSNRNHPWGRGKVTDLQGEIADAAVRALTPGRAAPEPEMALHPVDAHDPSTATVLQGGDG